MFTARDIRERMEGKPFKPFRVLTSDGRQYDVPNHDAAFVQRNVVHIGLDLDQEGFASRFVDCSILHIAGIEEMQAA